MVYLYIQLSTCDTPSTTIIAFITLLQLHKLKNKNLRRSVGEKTKNYNEKIPYEFRLLMNIKLINL